MQKKRKTIEWESLEISSRELEIPREHFMQDGHNKGRNGMDLTEAEDIRRGGNNNRRTVQKRSSGPR